MDVLQKEIDEVYATHPTAHEALDNGIVEQHQQFVRSLTCLLYTSDAADD